MQNVENLSEAQVRELRNRIYGRISDEGWQAVRGNWRPKTSAGSSRKRKKADRKIDDRKMAFG